MIHEPMPPRKNVSSSEPSLNLEHYRSVTTAKGRQ